MLGHESRQRVEIAASDRSDHLEAELRVVHRREAYVALPPKGTRCHRRVRAPVSDPGARDLYPMWWPPASGSARLEQRLEVT